jgi:Tfp pilus assembly protein PilX
MSSRMRLQNFDDNMLAYNRRACFFLDQRRNDKLRNVGRRRANEDGMVAVVVALVMVLLLLFVGLALDTSLARDRGSSLQLTADAAVLAAASALPDLALAQVRAQEAVSRNAAGVTATVAQVPGKPGQITVKISGKSQSTFSRIVGIKDYAINKSAYAEQSVGIAMGSPYNSIGTGDLPGMVPGDPAALQGYFLAINGPCTAKEMAIASQRSTKELADQNQQSQVRKTRMPITVPTIRIIRMGRCVVVRCGPTVRGQSAPGLPKPNGKRTPKNDRGATPFWSTYLVISLAPQPPRATSPIPCTLTPGTLGSARGSGIPQRLPTVELDAQLPPELPERFEVVWSTKYR